MSRNPLWRNLTTGLIALALLACGQSSSGHLGIRVVFPFRVAAIPDTTDTIGLLIRQGGRTLTEARLSRSKPSTILSALPTGPTDVIAVAFDKTCRPLATAKGQVDIAASTVNRVELNLGGLDAQLASLIPADCPPPPVPSPVASTTPNTSPTPTPTTSTASPSPSTVTNNGTTTNAKPSVTLSASETTVNEGMPISLKAAVTDPDTSMAAMTFTWTASPNVGSFTGSTTVSGNTAFRSWVPPLVGGATSVTLKVTVNDGTSSVTSSGVVVTVNDVATGSVTIGGTL